MCIRDRDKSDENLNVPKVRYIEGESINSIWGVPSLGINPANGKETYLAADGSLTDRWQAKMCIRDRAIGNEVYEALCDLEDKIGQETGEDQSGIEEEILDFIKRDTAWACIERLLGEKGFFSRILEINQTGHWACSWVGKFPKGNFIIL